MSDECIDPVRVMTTEQPNTSKVVTLDIGYATGGLRFGIVDDTGYHAINLPVDRASLLIEAIRLAAAEYLTAKKEAGK